MMFKLQYENSRGDSIELFGRPFRLSKVDGLGDVQAETQMQRVPYQDGAAYIDSMLEPRYPVIELKIYGQDAKDTEEKRRYLASIFNPKLGLGTLKYIRGDEEKVINAAAESVPFFPDGSTNRQATFQKVVLYLVCPNPYWRSTSITEEPAFEPLFEFPFDDLDGLEMGIQRTQRVITNDGDAPAPLQVDFYGPAESPIIENLRTGEFIRINRSLRENETFRIDTDKDTLFYEDAQGNKFNVFNWMDTDSSFFQLELGDNEITCHCAISNNQKDFDIRYQKLYVAV